MNAYNKLMHTLIGATITAALVAIPATASATQFQVQITGTGAFSAINYDSTALTVTEFATPLVYSGAGFSFAVGANNAPGGAPSFLDTTFGAYNYGTSNGTITILTSATDYTTLTAGSMANLVSSIGGTLVGNTSVTAQTWVNNDNGLNAMTGDTILMGPFNAGPSFGLTNFGDTSSTAFTASNPFSLTQQIILNVAAHGQTTGDMNTSIPEPGTLALLGLGLLGAGVLRRRQTKA